MDYLKLQIHIRNLNTKHHLRNGEMTEVGSIPGYFEGK